MLRPFFYFYLKHELLNTELYIARKVFRQKGKDKGIASKIVSIAVASISLGLTIMIVSVAVLLGFKKEVREKVIGFGAHFQIVNYDSNSSYETVPIAADSSLIQIYQNIAHVNKVQLFATKPGMVKTETDIHGIVLKGVDSNFDWKFFQDNLQDGQLPDLTSEKASNDVLISKKVASLLKLNVGDYLYCYFYNEGLRQPKNRRFTISGIYSSGMEEFDELFVMGDIRQVSNISGWHNYEITGYEITIDNFELMDEVENNLKVATLNNLSASVMLKVNSILKKYPTIFDWLSVLDINVWVLIVLMIAVAGINMISGVLIIIIERTQMIGILKAVGYSNISLRKVFLYLAAFLSIRGLIWGNLIGVGLCAFQYYTGMLKLDPVSYYIDTVPIIMNYGYLILLNAGTLIAIVAMIILPSMFISKISPIDSISFE